MKTTRLGISTFVLFFVTACGGAGGDNGPIDNTATVEAVSKFVGIWDLPDDWNNTANDEAYLVIKSPDDKGVSEVILYDYDDAQANCYFVEGDGELTQSLDGGFFLSVSVFTSAIVDLTPSGDLKISVFVENAPTGTPPEREFTASQETSITENELSPLC